MIRKVAVHDHQSSKKEIPAIFAHLPSVSSHKMNEHLLSRGAKSQNLHSLGFFSALVADSVGHAMVKLGWA